MRYNIMLQLVSFLTLVLLGMAAFFAWMQNRPAIEQSPSADKEGILSEWY
ncbi:MAG: hypothetical protein HC780_21815 [Leptolyngbyaceae cyanobacterium CSU_1_3]|nr:hypothetical protein [Leptolyngbyaceae cyanobacterium CSU_1_3]